MIWAYSQAFFLLTYICWLTYLYLPPALSLSLAVPIHQSIIQPATQPAASFEKNSLLYPKVRYLIFNINKPIPHRIAKISLPKDRVSPYEHLDRLNVK